MVLIGKRKYSELNVGEPSLISDLNDFSVNVILVYYKYTYLFYKILPRSSHTDYTLP
jgi:hypothetical protein